MKVEVDQSGKIGDTKVPPVLAFSNGKEYAILIPATVKRECLLRLRATTQSGKTLYLRLFAVGLYLLLKDHIKEFSQITIDLEYPGRNAEIKLYLMNLLNRRRKSNAHNKALAVYQKIQRPNKQIVLSQILDEFKKP
jgi:hypothetical protein